MARSHPAPADVGATNNAATNCTAPRFLNVRQLAEYLQINEKKVYALATAGTLPGTKVTGKWLFPRDLVDRWLLQTSHGGVLTDKLLMAGGDDPLLHRLTADLAGRLGSRAVVSYCPTPTRLGLSLLDRARIEVSVLHWGPVAESNNRHPGVLRAYPAHANWVLVRAFRRQQGLLLRRGLAQTLGTVAQALRERSLRWVQRNEGSGTQRFFRELQVQHSDHVPEMNIVAAAESGREAAGIVAAASADAVPGCQASATEFGLDFLAAGWEALDLVVGRDAFFRTLFQKILQGLRAPEVERKAAALGGYDLSESGHVVWGS